MISNAARSSGRYKRFCVVGMGKHARTKLIPAMIANGQEIVGLVTTQSGSEFPAAPVFRRIEDALSSVAPDTLFVIATPPAVHFEQVMAVIGAGYDLVVEKPAFVTAREAIEALAGVKRQGTVLIEAFMYRHTELYRRLMECWRAERASIRAVEVAFFVPGMPPDSFRQDGAIASSSLYDIGSYALSLFADLDLPFQSLDLKSVDFAGDCDREAVHLEGIEEGVHLDVRLGIDPVYINSVLLRSASRQTTTFSPFFYGRPVERQVLRKSASETFSEAVYENNAYEEMFAVPRDIWLGNQPTRGRQMIEITAVLQRLGQTLATARKKVIKN